MVSAATLPSVRIMCLEVCANENDMFLLFKGTAKGQRLPRMLHHGQPFQWQAHQGLDLSFDDPIITITTSQFFHTDVAVPSRAAPTRPDGF
jgi:hypothetical protein